MLHQPKAEPLSTEILSPCSKPWWDRSAGWQHVCLLGPFLVTGGVKELGAGSGLKLPSSCGRFRTGNILAVLGQPALTHCQRHTFGDLQDEPN